MEREILSDAERLKILLRYKNDTYAEGSKYLSRMFSHTLTELEAMADLLGFEFSRHDSRDMEEIIDDEAPLKYREKMHEVLHRYQQITDEELQLYRATHEFKK